MMNSKVIPPKNALLLVNHTTVRYLENVALALIVTHLNEKTFEKETEREALEKFVSDKAQEFWEIDEKEAQELVELLVPGVLLQLLTQNPSVTVCEIVGRKVTEWGWVAKVFFEFDTYLSPG